MTSARTGRPLVAAVLGALMLESLWRSARAAGSLGALLSPGTSWPFDYPLTSYLVEAGARIFQETGHLWGYEPHFMAGYPLVYLEHNLFLLQLVEAAAPSLPAGGLIRSTGALMLAAVPLLFYGSARLLDVGRGGALVVAAVGHGATAVGELAIFTATTPISSGWAALLLLPVLGIAHRFLAGGGRRATLAFVLAPAAVLALHKGALVVLPVPLAIFALALGTRSSWRRVAAGYLGSASAAVLLNLAWILPLARYLHVRTDHPPPFWILDDGWRALAELVSPVAGFDFFDPAEVLGGPLLVSWAVRVLVTVLGAAGLAVLVRRGRGALAAALAATLVYLGWLSYCGGGVQWIARTEPYRYVVAFRALWAVAAGFAFDAMLAARRPLPRAAVVALAVGVALAPHLGRSWASFVVPGQLAPEPPAAVVALERWVRDDAPPRGRLMVEDAWARFGEPSVLDNSYALGWVALRTDRELIGGRVPYFRVPHRFASFVDGEAFGLPIRAQHPGRLRRYLELYDVTAIAAWHPDSVAALDALAAEPGEPALRATTAAAPWHFYRVEREADPFERGRGRVVARWGALELADVEPEDGAVVLRYHWMDGLRAEPDARLEPVYLEDDPVPFIRVLDPPTALRLTPR